jgi:hypothetical protein
MRMFTVRSFAAPLRWVVAVAVALCFSGAVGAVGVFTPTGPMSGPHSDHTATVLLDGRVLVTGGFTGSGYTASAEIYDGPPLSPPTANAGPDQTVTADSFGQATVTLAGTAAGVYVPLTSEWSGPGGFLAAGTTVPVSLTIGRYEFELTVTDTGGLSATDTVMSVRRESRVFQVRPARRVMWVRWAPRAPREPQVMSGRRDYRVRRAPRVAQVMLVRRVSKVIQVRPARLAMRVHRAPRVVQVIPVRRESRVIRAPLARPAIKV